MSGSSSSTPTSDHVPTLRKIEPGRPASAEPVMKEIRDQQEPIGGGKGGIVLSGHRGELEDGVDRQKLDARPVVELARRNTLEHRSKGRRTPVIAVVDGILQQL